jgi:hypothetical protein
MNPQTILCDELIFIENTGLDARGFFTKLLLPKHKPLIGILCGKKGAWLLLPFR